MSGIDAIGISTTILEHVRSAQAALRFECLRSERDGMRAQLLDALAGLSEAEAMLLDALRLPIANEHQTFTSVRRWSKKALDVTEKYFHELVEAPGIGTNLEAILIELLPAEPVPETTQDAT
jgi:hypothetical protein